MTKSVDDMTYNFDLNFIIINLIFKNNSKINIKF